MVAGAGTACAERCTFEDAGEHGVCVGSGARLRMSGCNTRCVRVGVGVGARSRWCACACASLCV